MKLKETNRLRDSIAVILPRKLYRRYQLIILECNKRKIAAGTLPNDHPDVRKKVSDNELLITRKALKILGGDITDVRIIFPKNNLFVYGTLLSRYINLNYHEICSGWGAELRSFPYVRCYVNEYKLIWNILPYAIPGDGKILGELYLNVSEEVLDDINHIEISAGYNIAEVTVKTIENLVSQAEISAIMYEYQKIRNGKNLFTIRFPDAYLCNHELIHHTYTEFFDILQGNIPIIITAPHGGYIRPEDIPRHHDRGADEETYELARKILEHVYTLSNRRYIPSFIGSLLHRTRCDPNRTPANKYEKLFHDLLHNLVRTMQKKFKQIVLLDIHGMRITRESQIDLGTCNKTTIKSKEIYDILLSEFSSKYITSENMFPGGYITQKYGHMEKINAIQIEIRKDLRLLNKIDETAKLIAEIIIKIINEIE